MKSVNIIDKATGNKLVAMYAANRLGNMRFHVNDKPLSDKEFDAKYRIDTTLPKVEAVGHLGSNPNIYLQGDGEIEIVGTINPKYDHLVHAICEAINSYSAANDDFSIYVTISEFLSKGGTLTKGREFYRKYDDGRGYYHTSEFVKMNGDSIIARNGQGEYPVNQHMWYVKIPCTPIYK